MSDLIVITNPVGSKLTPNGPAAYKIRRQADQVLERHTDDLPQEIVTMLRSPFVGIVQQGLEAAKPILAEIVASKKEELIKASPECSEVRDLLARANFVFTGEVGDQVRRKLHQWALDITAMPAEDIIIEQGRIKQLRDAVRFAEKFEAKFKAKQPKKRTKATPPPATALHPIIEGTPTRERKPKPAKPQYTGLPPVCTDSTDISFVEDKAFAVIGAANAQGGPPQRGVAVQKNLKQKQKGQKGGGVKTRPGRRN
jgi:hypothetical protein